MTCDDNFLAHLGILICGSWQLKLGMSIIALLTIGTEASQVVNTEHSPHMTVATVGTMATETSVIPGTVSYLGLRINVKERTFFVVTGIESGVEVALRHFAHIILM